MNYTIKKHPLIKIQVESGDVFVEFFKNIFEKLFSFSEFVIY